MRKILSVLMLAWAVAVAAQPQVKWLEEVHNFGAFDENDGKVTCNFKFVNTGSAPLIIKAVHVTCGCTAPTFDKGAVAPGDTGYVAVSYDPTGRPGRFEKKLYVDMNTEPSRHSLYIKGSVVGVPSTVNARFPKDAGPVRLRTPSVPFGDVLKGKSKSYFLDAYNASTDTVAPRWESLPPYMSVGSPQSEIFPGENITYTFMLSTDRIPVYGLVTDSIKFIPDPVKIPEDFYWIPVMAMVNEDFSRLTPGQRRDAPEIAVSDPVVDFGDISGATATVSRTFQITNRGKNPLIIRRVYTTDPGFTIDVSADKVKSGKHATVTVSFNTAFAQGTTLSGRLLVISNDPAQPVTPVRLSGLISTDK